MGMTSAVSYLAHDVSSGYFTQVLAMGRQADGTWYILLMT